MYTLLLPFHEQMLLSQCCNHRPLSSKSITDQSPIHSHLTPPFSFSIFSSPKTPKKPPKPQTTRFSRPDAQPLPQSAITRIAEKLRSLGFSEDAENPGPEAESLLDSSTVSAGEIFIPLRSQLPNYRVGHTIDTSWSTPHNPVPQPGSGGFVTRYNELRSEVTKEKELERRKRKDIEKVPTLAELKLPAEELGRLRSIGIKLKKKLKIGKAGITEGIVNGIHERWQNAELVKITCEDLCKMNMKRTHDLLERKTGGLVVWRSGSNIILYRGADYRYPYFLVEDVSPTPNAQLDLSGQSEKDSYPTTVDDQKSIQLVSMDKAHCSTLIQGVGSPNRVRFQLPGEAQLTEEADSLLDGLGPRYTDWWGYEPLPVDADLLPAIIPGYRRPLRLLPYGVNPKLTNDEMTTLRRLGRPLPCHFALGRNRNLQGLAAAIVKLWEKCEIAKIAVKRGVQNTNSEMMAEELRRLTGGLLLSRDREFIVLYRGKDFLPSAVSSAIEERRKHRVQGEKPTEFLQNSSLSDTVHEDEIDKQTKDCSTEQNNLVAVQEAITRTSTKLSLALAKKAQAEKMLAELQEHENVEQPDVDKEGITTEERYMLRKVGLRMKPFLLMGKRGIFDGTIENMHLHWKYRELVKVICKEKSIEDVHHVARTLEAESGGILVAVERVNKGYAVIVYRGKNYRRPACIRPKTLVNKRGALKRSLEAQRSESLKLHVLKLSRNIDQLKLQLDDNKEKIAAQSLEEVGSQQVGSNHGDVSSSVRSDEEDTSLSMPKDRQVVEKIDFAMKCEAAGSCHVKTECLPSSVHEEFHQSLLDGKVDGGVSEFTFNDASELKDRYSKAGNDMHLVPGYEEIESMESSAQIAEDKLDQLKAVATMPLRSLSLSNKERLLLRKHALQMKKRPLLSVGRSNVVTGVAKAIKAHFEKHPVAIVNVKGRAKGTSVQELAFKLEQETGAVLVSQEPNKVILYRGWGAEDILGDSKEITRVTTKMSENLGRSCPTVTPELIEAIKLECGLQSYQEEQVTG